jgi:hypothetical protein
MSCFGTMDLMNSFCIFLIICNAYSATDPNGPITEPFSIGHVGPTKVIRFGISGILIPAKFTNQCWP